MEKNELKEKQIKEALLRMKLLRFDSSVVNLFKKEQKLFYSERQSKIFNAVLYWLDNKPEYVELVKKFEDQTHYLVYHCQLTHFEFGDCLTLLFVTDNEEEWVRERMDLNSGCIFSYVINLDDSENSEFGTVGIKPSMGGVLRTA